MSTALETECDSGASDWRGPKRLMVMGHYSGDISRTCIIHTACPLVRLEGLLLEQSQFALLAMRRPARHTSGIGHIRGVTHMASKA